MSIFRKMFLTFSCLFIVTLGVFMTATYLSVQQLTSYMSGQTQQEMMTTIESKLIDHYRRHHGWNNLNQLTIGLEDHWQIVPHTRGSNTIPAAGRGHEEQAVRLGIPHSFSTPDGQTWTLYYLDSAVRIIAILKYAVRDALVLSTIAGGLLLIVITLVITYFISKKLTAPVRTLIPVMDQIAGNQFHVRAEVHTSDEFARVAATLNNMMDDLQKAEQTRRQLTTDIAHELRTPLTIIQGKLESLQQRQKALEPHELLPLQDEILRLKKLVTDLQQLSLAESDHLQLNQQSTNLVSFCQDIVSQFSLEADEQGITLSYRCQQDTLYSVIDTYRMTQVIINLLWNAIRYTPRNGTIVVQVYSTGEEACIEISDSGIGIAPDQIPKLFQRFYRTDEARNRVSGGSGLGLAIAWEYVRLHGGTIEVESQLRQGATFRILLPLESRNER
ncbi:sensor histidine kinase [Paenibacillus senegalensis]|uniref:sensor histidine kinase n=1 Tax=Paenibacillus senegalensis TaxID=1465766 RepID=UPI000289A12C|nr:ATP-binding protein [Paenibacillus senegalensis]